MYDNMTLEQFEWMDTILTEYREWEDYEKDMETNPYSEQ